MIFKKLATNCLVLTFVAAVGLIIHLAINNLLIKAIETNQIIYSYCINVILACSVISILFLFKRKLKDQLGFIFMGLSMLKFVFFFILFYPQYNSDGNLNRIEFFTFFIPYTICLVTECIILAKFLNNLDKSN